MMRAVTIVAPLLVWLLGLAALPAAAQEPDTRAALQALRFPAQRFTPPRPKQVRLSNGIPVYLLEDHTLPLLRVQLVSKVGAANVPDSLWAVAQEAGDLLRTGGTTRLSPDSIDKVAAFYAIGFGFQVRSEKSRAMAAGLSRHRDRMLDLLFDAMLHPRNDTARVRIAATRAEEAWRRRNDEPNAVLERALGQVMYGDHPLGRTLATPAELASFTPARFRWVQERVFCPQQVIFGVSGDFDERALLQELEEHVRGWPACKPGLRATPPVSYAEGPRVVLVEKDVNQSNLVLAHRGGVREANTPDYFAAQVANFILGGGAGFSARLLQRVRSDSGFAYSVGSEWDAEPKREGLFSAGAQVRAEKTVAALGLMRRTIGSLATEPATESDVKLAQDKLANSFVFQFEDPTEIVQQQLAYAADGLPANWFDVYLRGVQAVTPQQVRQAAQRYLHPDRLVTLVVGQTASFGGSLEQFGPVTTLPVDAIQH